MRIYPICFFLLILGGSFVVADTQAIRKNYLSATDHILEVKRIIALSPAITELVFSAGAGTKLVGVSRFSNFPSAATTIPEIGDAYNLDFERIIELRPDLIIIWKQGNTDKNIDRLVQLGMQLLEVDITSLDEIPDSVRIIGKLAGTEDYAELAASQYEDRLFQIKQNYGNKTKINVLQLIWLQPLITFGESHLINEIFSVCSGESAINTHQGNTYFLATENFIAANPDVILDSTASDPAASGMHVFLKKYPLMNAVKNEHIFFVSPDLMLRETLRILDAIQIVCDYLDEVRKK